MARASVRTILPLDTFAKILNVHPLHFNQVSYPQETDNTGMDCGEPLLQYSWLRADKTGREEIAEVIALAEQRISLELGYLPGVAWIADENLAYPRPSNPALFNSYAIDIRGYNQSFRTKFGYVISGGIEGKSVILTDAAITYTDEDGDGYFETATVSAPTSVTDTDEIALFYPDTDGDNSWEIRPLRSVTISGGVVTVVCNREQLLIVNLQRGYSEATSRAADSQNDTNFLTTLDIYRRYNDPSTQAQLVWAPLAVPCGCLIAGSCEVCTLSLQNACLLTRDARLGVVSASPATWDATAQTFTTDSLALWRAPDRVRAYYRSGFRNLRLTRPNNTMDPDLARIITYYAASMLDRPLCACKPLEAQIAYWRQDLATTVATRAGATSWKINDSVLNNPLGTTRGAVNAWQVIKKLRLGEGVDNA